ncbi:MAG: aminotransferase class V-fold PLP-dependent enzyme [Dehalococcoidales bacterium]|nr:aminotransferase class V-fold PLP-dependent enzyme [Dehalococcoidales bacterium]
MKDYIYLNNSATSYPKPECVVTGVEHYLRKAPFHHSRAGFDNESGDIVSECRNKLAVLFNAPEPSRIVFSSGATESLNAAIKGLALKGKHVVTTASEHNSVLRPLKTLERDECITLSIVDCDENGLVPVDKIEETVNLETGAVIVNHCSNVTGTTNDIETIGKLVQRTDAAFIVDASQSAGVYNIDVQKMNIDILVFTGHKALYGMQGTGGAYIREGIALEPLKVGGTGVRSDYLYQPETMPMYYEAGTMNLPGILSLCTGVNYLLETGIDSMRKRKEEIVSRIRNALAEYEAVSLYPGREYSGNTTLFCFTIEGLDPSDIGYLLENSYNIIVRSGLHCAPLIHKRIGSFPDGSIRVSPSYFTQDGEVEVFIDAVRQILQMVD